MKFFFTAFDWLKKVFTNTGWEHAAQVAITLMTPLIETLAQLFGGPAVGAEVAQIMNTVKVDMGVVNTTLVQIQSGAGNVNTVTLLKNTLASIKTNLTALLQVADVKNADTKGAVTMTVNTIVGEVDAILESIPAAG